MSNGGDPVFQPYRWFIGDREVSREEYMQYLNAWQDPYAKIASETANISKAVEDIYRLLEKLLEARGEKPRIWVGPAEFDSES